MRISRKIEAENVFGENVRACLKKRGLSLRKLGFQLHIPYQTLHRWVSGKTYPTLDKVYLIADALDTTILDLLDPTAYTDGKEKSISTDISHNYKVLYQDIFGNDAKLPKNYVSVISTTLKNVLSEKELAIITSRYGLNGEGPLPMSDVANEYNVSRQRIHQIIDRSFQKLRFASDTFARTANDLSNKEPKEKDSMDWAKHIPVLELHDYLTNHTINALVRNGMSSLYDVFQKTDYELGKEKGVGKDAVTQIQKMRCTLQSYDDYINKVP